MINLKLLSPEQIKKIHKRSLDILEQIGANVDSGQAREILADHGCRIEERRVYFPAELVDSILQERPAKPVLYSRKGECLASGTGKVYFHNGGTVSSVIDILTGKQRKAALEDARKLTRLIDSLENIHALAPVVYPQDVEQKLSMIYMIKAMVENTTKPVTGPGVSSLRETQFIHEIFLTLSGDQKNFREKPLYSIGYSPQSPLILPEEDTETLIWAVKQGIPVAILPCPIAGLTAPITLLGSLTQQNAEVLAALTLIRLIDPQLPLSYSARLSYSDLRYGNVFGGPEAAITGACAVQLAGYYGLEANVYGAGGSSFVGDEQMGFEKAFNILMPAVVGSDWLSGAGMVGEASAVSYEQMVLDNEIFAVVLQLLDEIKDDQEDLGFSVIRDVMDKGQDFIIHENTMRYLRSEEIWDRSKMISNSGNFHQWSEQGSRSIVKLAREEVEKILAEHEVEPLTDHVRKEIDNIIAGARKELL